LHDDIEAGTPIVGLEPSCVAAFRDELIQMYPIYEDAKRLNIQVLTLAEFLDSKAQHVELPRLHRHAIVHGHCHQKAVMGLTSEQKIMKRVGLHFDLLDSGCCGMAGSFGFKSGDHYDVSLKVGEMTLLPAVRKAPKDALIIADGFSCREQIAQTTDRRALHLAQVMQMALREGPRSGPSRGGTDYPERNYFMPRSFHQGIQTKEIAVVAGAGLLIAGGLLWMLKRKRR
jgi:Fe-S oxidoreductase